MLGSDEDRVWRPRPRDLLGALGLLTAWPAERPEVQSQDFGRATPFFPLAGLLIGAVLVGLNWLMGPGLPAWAAGLVLVVAWEALAGGAMPRAAWALGATASGREERWLAGLVLSTTLLAKIACLAPQTSSRPAALLFAPMLARWAMVVLATGARDADAPGRKFNSAITFREFALASIFTCIVVFTLAEALGILLVACVAAATLAGRLLAHHRAGGVSWRMLLASAEAIEALVLLLFVLLGT
jgi:adenosylcobinamide-GDP ribazoletransferase